MKAITTILLIFIFSTAFASMTTKQMCNQSLSGIYEMNKISKSSESGEYKDVGSKKFVVLSKAWLLRPKVKNIYRTIVLRKLTQAQVNMVEKLFAGDSDNCERAGKNCLFAVEKFLDKEGRKHLFKAVGHSLITGKRDRFFRTTFEYPLVTVQMFEVDPVRECNFRFYALSTNTSSFYKISDMARGNDGSVRRFNVTQKNTGMKFKKLSLRHVGKVYYMANF